jgi:hypothetical protein
MKTIILPVLYVCNLVSDIKEGTSIETRALGNVYGAKKCGMTGHLREHCTEKLHNIIRMVKSKGNTGTVISTLTN